MASPGRRCVARSRLISGKLVDADVVLAELRASR
jgi:hypothetical protein